MASLATVHTVILRYTRCTGTVLCMSSSYLVKSVADDLHYLLCAQFMSSVHQQLTGDRRFFAHNLSRLSFFYMPIITSLTDVEYRNNATRIPARWTVESEAIDVSSLAEWAP